MRIAARLVSRAKRRHSDGKYILFVCGAVAYQKRERAVEPARNSYDSRLCPCRSHSRRECARLHRKYQFGAFFGLVAARNERELFYFSVEFGVAFAYLEINSYVSARRGFKSDAATLCVKPTEIDVGYGAPVPERHTLGKHRAVFGYYVMPRKHYVGRRLAFARIGIDVCRMQSARRAANKQSAVIGFSNHLVGRGKIGYHRRARARKLDGRRNVRPHILAYLAPDSQKIIVRTFEKHIAHRRAAQFVDVFHPVESGREIPLFIKLAVIGQFGLGNKSEHRAVAYTDRAVVQPSAKSYGRAHYSQHTARKLFGERVQCDDRVVEQFTRKEKIGGGISRNAQFGKHGDFDAASMQLLGDRARIAAHVSYLYGRRRRRNLDEIEFHIYLANALWIKRNSKCG